MKILITGATGLIGKQIVKACVAQGIHVNYLTTNRDKIQDEGLVKGFYWNPASGVIDANCFTNVTAIIHLAGASIAKRWTPSYKEEIVESRTVTTSLLYTSIKKLNNRTVNHVITASAIGAYPHSYTNYYTEEEQDIDNSFVGEVVEKWEQSVDSFLMLGIKVSKIRTGLVLAKNGGMLAPIVKSVKYYMGTTIAGGKQWQSWIHIDDMVGIYLHVLQNQLEGVYNAVAPNPVTNKKMTYEVAGILKKPVWPFTMPAFMLKLLLGQMSYITYSSQRVAAHKIEQTGYVFKFTTLKFALENLLLEKSIF